MFWRREFWGKPGFFLGYAVLALAVGVVAMFPLVESVIVQQAISADRICGADVRARCLEEAQGTLRGPYPVRKSVNESWSLDLGGRRTAAIQLGPTDSDRLRSRSGTEVEALVYESRAVVITTSDGATFRDLESGVRGALFWGGSASFMVAVAVGLVRQATGRRRASGSWWRNSGPEVVSGRRSIAIVMMTPGVFVIGISLGATWWTAIVIAAIVMLAASGVLPVDRWWPRGRGGRHARRSAA